MDKNISTHTHFFQSIKSGLFIPGNDQSKDACIRKIILFPLKKCHIYTNRYTEKQLCVRVAMSSFKLFNETQKFV